MLTEQERREAPLAASPLTPAVFDYYRASLRPGRPRVACCCRWAPAP
jgi:hypothetical protein